MQTKQELLDRMKALEACEEATEWVEAQETNSAVEIWQSCPDVYWLIWFGGRQNSKAIAAFAQRCAERAKGYAARATTALYAADYAADYAAAYAHAAARAADYADAAAAAGYAADAADYAADAADAERKLQLEDLKANVNEYLGV